MCVRVRAYVSVTTMYRLLDYVASPRFQIHLDSLLGAPFPPYHLLVYGMINDAFVCSARNNWYANTAAGQCQHATLEKSPFCAGFLSRFPAREEAPIVECRVTEKAGIKPNKIQVRKCKWKYNDAGKI